MQKNKRCEMRRSIFEGRAHVSSQRADALTNDASLVGAGGSRVQLAGHPQRYQALRLPLLSYPGVLMPNKVPRWNELNYNRLRPFLLRTISIIGRCLFSGYPYTPWA
jgi:hypothetical protein